MHSAKMPRRPSDRERNGPRPAKAAHSTRKSPSPESPCSDNASDNSDLFQWATLDSPAAAHIAPSFAAINASRKRKLLEQYFASDFRPGPLSTPPPPRPRSPPGPFAFTFSSHRSHSGSCQHSSTESLCSSQGQEVGTGQQRYVNVCQEKDVSEVGRHERSQRSEEDSPEKVSSSPLSHGMERSVFKPPKSPMRHTGWHAELLDDIDNNLAADFDGSLSGLGVDLSAASYNMSEALLALPSLTVFKQETPSPSPSTPNDGKTGDPSSPGGSLRRSSGTSATGGPTSFSHLLQNHNFWHHQSQSLTIEPHPLTTGVGTGSASSLASSCSNDGNQQLDSAVFGGPDLGSASDYRFQYILAASTSVATKISEETLTYLNQGQSYEIKLRRFGQDLHRGKLLKSVVRLCFHDRRLQYMEREQIMAWRLSNPGSRIMEVDIPLSYGVSDVSQDQVSLNAATFTWDPSKEAGIYVKVHCISTEFTPKKHGGEKGVPFRIQIETYEAEDLLAKRFHAGACQIKVFKLKGGDRKHKQDREKLLKRPQSEQDKFQPQSNFTLFSDISVDSLASLPSNGGEQPNTSSSSFPRNASATEIKPVFHLGDPQDSPSHRQEVQDNGLLSADIYNLASQPLYPETNAMQVTQWLQANRFGTYIATFNRFSGADLLRLTRDDLVQILGIADGIRLFNVLHSRMTFRISTAILTTPVIPRLTIYICVSTNHVYNALYLQTGTCCELIVKLAQVVQLSGSNIKDVFLQGPGGIRVLVTDEVVTNLKDESTYNAEVMREPSEDTFCLILKPSANF